MSMETWVKKVHEINTYNPECRDAMDYYYNTNLSQNISPLTKFFLNTFTNTLDQKNVIVTFPDNILRPLPIMLIFILFYKKSTLVFTSKCRASRRKVHVKSIIFTITCLIGMGSTYSMIYQLDMFIKTKLKLKSKCLLPIGDLRKNILIT